MPFPTKRMLWSHHGREQVQTSSIVDNGWAKAHKACACARVGSPHPQQQPPPAKRASEYLCPNAPLGYS
eukprot:CAMPEP_0183434618 /NCGR_PEP_ID=MMETSP0370-20130417/64083_1 /TAXON_ID=268820 /ORGANISM="Peridinium aciculiferum, Strain PAER-2" /LENGTH=68 /DNA_ID=CAMNT_0025621357 /DNA_START=140 /DNA_END=342 /DNA_ORIENTATION=-